MDWWNISVFGIIPVFSVAIIFCFNKRFLWVTPLISTALSYIISVVLSSIVTIAAMPSILSDYEHRALFFLSLILQLAVIIILNVSTYVIAFILNKKKRK